MMQQLRGDFAVAFRNQFPSVVEQSGTVFFDNASTTQKPQTVLSIIEQFYRDDCANAGRAAYSASIRAALAIERARATVAEFISANPGEIAFTSGATDSLNAVAWSWGIKNLRDRDEVLVCMDDHSSAVLPWLNLQRTLKHFGISIELVPFHIHQVGDYDLRSIERALSPRTRVIALSHVHHVYGLDMEICRIREMVGPDVLMTLDASQSIGHTGVDATALGADFISFSGHKMFAANGVGVLFAKSARHEEMIPLRSGGKADVSSHDEFVGKIESGTPNIPGIASMTAAVEFIREMGLARIESHIAGLTQYLVRSLQTFPRIVFAPGPVICGCPGGLGILSFRFEQASSFDVASALAAENILVRSGMHCRPGKMPDEDDYIRVSMHAYNNELDIDNFVAALKELLE